MCVLVLLLFKCLFLTDKNSGHKSFIVQMEETTEEQIGLQPNGLIGAEGSEVRVEDILLSEEKAISFLV